MQRAAVLPVLFLVACAPEPIRRPTPPLPMVVDAPEEVQDDAERVDRLCSAKEAQLVFDYQEGKEEQESFKTIMGSVTGSVGTAGGVIGGVGAFVASDDDVKTITGVTGFVSAGLGAVGAVVTGVVTPGKEKMEGAQLKLAAIEERKSAARAALESKRWGEEGGDAKRALADLEQACQ